MTTDGHDAYPRAVREVLGEDVLHRTNRYLTNLIEQDHRPVKQRYYPMRGFKTVRSAAHFCSAYEEQRQYFRARRTTGERVSLGEQRRLFRERWVGGARTPAMALGLTDHRWTVAEVLAQPLPVPGG